MFFLGNNLKFGRCQKCRPVFPGFYEEIGNHITKLKIINSLKTDEESGNKTFERLTKKRRLSRCKYRRTKKKKEIELNKAFDEEIKQIFDKLG